MKRPTGDGKTLPVQAQSNSGSVAMHVTECEARRAVSDEKKKGLASI